MNYKAGTGNNTAAKMETTRLDGVRNKRKWQHKQDDSYQASSGPVTGVGESQDQWTVTAVLMLDTHFYVRQSCFCKKNTTFERLISIPYTYLMSA